MTLQEASRRFHIKMEVLQLYLENDLLAGDKTEDGILDFQEADIQRAMQFRFLQKAGMDLKTLKHLVRLTETKTDTTSEQVKLLRKCRHQLLEEIHGKQQCLDELDYYIYEIKQQRTKKENSHEKNYLDSIGASDGGNDERMSKPGGTAATEQHAVCQRNSAGIRAGQQ